MADAGAAMSSEAATRRAGLIYALLAYGWWGSAVPYYIHHFRDVSAFDLLTLRVIAGLPFILAMLLIARQLGGLRTLHRNPRARWRLPIAAVLLGLNWFGFIWALVQDRALEASLGYYLNPLVSVALGVIFLGERMRPLQIVGVLCAMIGVGIAFVSAAQAGSIASMPWLALMVAASFGFYGLLRKQSDTPAMLGLGAEWILLLPAALLLPLFTSPQTDVIRATEVTGWRFALLMAMGIVTVLPLLWFGSAARRLPLATVGVLQYIAPTGQFIMAITLFGDTFTPSWAATFIAVWVGVTLYCLDLARHARSARRAASST